MEGMRKRAVALAVAARDLSSGSTAVQQPSPGERPNPAQRAFVQLADCLEGLALFLARLGESEGIQAQLLEEELSSEENLLQGYKGRSSLYLLMCSPKIMAELQECGKRLRRGIEALGGTARMDASLLERLSEGFRPTGDDEALIDSLDEGMLDTIVIDTALCRRLARQIAEGVGMEVGSEGFTDEVEKLRCEQSAAEARGGKVHALYLEQFLLVLDRALRSSRGDSIEGDEDGEHEQAKRMKQLLASLSICGRDAPMLPLQPFICPITRDVMRDPVQIASGQTYEREAIERWFAEGNTRCPVTSEELPTTQMKSNFALKQSIAEWRERNYEARLHCTARCLLGEPRGSETECIVRAMRDIRTVCEEEPLNKYKVGTVGLIGPMVKQLHDARDAVAVRKEALGALAVLARDNFENQESMVKAGIVELLVFSLTRQKEDLGEAVLVMKVLSENPSTAELISHAQGAVVFLVTLLGCEDEDVNSNVKDILENVPSSDDNVLIMAEANLMRPLANRLVEGSIESRIVMAKALAAMHLPDSSKTSLATEDVLVSLLRMIESPRREENEAALGALQNLTSVPDIAETVLDLHGFRLMENKLSSVKTVEEIKVGAARILADLSKIAGDTWSGEDEATTNNLEVYIYKFLQLMGSLAPVGVQSYVLSTFLGLANGKNIGAFTRAKLCEHKALQILLPLLKNPASTPSSAAPTTPAMVADVRRHAMELFCLLSKESSREASVAMRERPEIMADLVKNLSEDPERTSILGIIASMEDGVVRSALDHHQQDGDKSLLHVVAALVVDASQDAATVEAAVGIVLNFAKLGVETQKKLAEAGAIERLVQLLEPGRSMLTRRRAAQCLAEFSSSSWSLGRRKQKKEESCTKSVVYLCLPWLAPRGPTRFCRVHGGECTARHTFCLAEAAAVEPLVALLKDAAKADAADAAGGAAAALAALATLTGGTDDDSDVSTEEHHGSTEGCHAIDKAKGLSAVIAAVSSGGRDAQCYALVIVDRLFSDPKYCEQYGPSAQMHVIFAAQTGDSKARRAAGRILRRLELIHSQSNYFGAS